MRDIIIDDDKHMARQLILAGLEWISLANMSMHSEYMTTTLLKDDRRVRKLIQDKPGMDYQIGHRLAMIEASQGRDETSVSPYLGFRVAYLNIYHVRNALVWDATMEFLLSAKPILGRDAARYVAKCIWDLRGTWYD